MNDFIREIFVGQLASCRDLNDCYTKSFRDGELDDCVECAFRFKCLTRNKCDGRCNGCDDWEIVGIGGRNDWNTTSWRMGEYR